MFHFRNKCEFFISEISYNECINRYAMKIKLLYILYASTTSVVLEYSNLLRR